MTIDLAEFGFGTLRQDWDRPAVQAFVAGPDPVDGVAERSPGFVSRLCDDETGAARDAPGEVFGENPGIAAPPSVWDDAASRAAFDRTTVLRQFYARKAAWYDAIGTGNPVLWRVPVGHRPSLAEGMARRRHLNDNSNSDHAVGGSYLKDAAAGRNAPLSAYGCGVGA